MHRDCFGLPALCMPARAPCKDCAQVEGCRSAALSELDSYGTTPHVSAARARLVAVFAGAKVDKRGHPLVPMSKHDERAIEGLPARARNIARRLHQEGFFLHAREEISRGLVPACKPRSISAALQLLMSGPTARADLVGAISEQLQLTKGSAEVEASTVIAVLRFGGLLGTQGGLLLLQHNAT